MTTPGSSERTSRRAFRSLQLVGGVLILLAVGVIVRHRVNSAPAPLSPVEPKPPPGQGTPVPPFTAGPDEARPPQSIFDLPIDPALASAPSPQALPTLPSPAPPAQASVPVQQSDAVAAPTRERAKSAPAGRLTFNRVKLVTVDGTKGRAQDVLLNFKGTEFTVVTKKGGLTLSSLPYGRVTHATYTRAKAPEWSRAASGPPPGFDVPHGIFDQGAHHWLVLQTRTDYLILRLGDGNWREVLQWVPLRTGVTVTQRTTRDRRRG